MRNGPAALVFILYGTIIDAIQNGKAIHHLLGILVEGRFPQYQFFFLSGNVL